MRSIEVILESNGSRKKGKKYNDKKQVKLLWIQRRILGFVLTFYWRQNLFQFEHLKQQLGTRQN